MTQKDIAALIVINKTTFPNAYKEMSKEEKASLLDVWYALFKDYDCQVVRFSFLKALEICKFPVTPSDIFDRLRKISNAAEMTEEELWIIFQKAVGKAGDLHDYYRISQDNKYISELNEVYAGLPEEIRQFAGDASQLIAYANIEIDELTKFIKPNFHKRILNIRDRLKTLKETPAQLLEMASKSLKSIDSDDIKKIEG